MHPAPGKGFGDPSVRLMELPCPSVWLRRRESNAPKSGYEPNRTPGLTALVGAPGVEPGFDRYERPVLAVERYALEILRPRWRLLRPSYEQPEPCPPLSGFLERPWEIESHPSRWQRDARPPSRGRKRYRDGSRRWPHPSSLRPERYERSCRHGSWWSTRESNPHDAILQGSPPPQQPCPVFALRLPAFQLHLAVSHGNGPWPEAPHSALVGVRVGVKRTTSKRRCAGVPISGADRHVRVPLPWVCGLTLCYPGR